MELMIYKKLKDFFSPEYLEVINESSLHAGHKSSPNNGNSHFYIKIKANRFTKITMLDSHKLIYSLLNDEMRNQIHALRIKIIK
tara:strand:+ start:164 stop:415 length:252 start_codon:yes stop_codon:yes gene_type:complete